MHTKPERTELIKMLIVSQLIASFSLIVSHHGNVTIVTLQHSDDNRNNLSTRLLIEQVDLRKNHHL